MFGWVRVTINGTTYSHLHQSQDMSCGATSIALLVWNCGYGLGSEVASRWTMRGVERTRLGRNVLGDDDPMDDMGTDEARIAPVLKNYYGLNANVLSADHFRTMMSGAPHDWTSFIVGVYWTGGGGHLITVIVRGTDALVFDPGEDAGTIHVVPSADLVGDALPNRSLNVPGIAGNRIDRAVHVPPQRSGVAMVKNLLQTPAWLYQFGRTGFRLW